MNRPFLFGVLIAVAGCSSSANSNTSQDGGGQGNSGFGGQNPGSGGQNTGTGAQGNPGSGGQFGGNGGVTGSGGNQTSSGGAGNAGGANGGAAGSSGGVTGTGGTVSGPPIDTATSVLERNNHPNRDGNFVQAALTKTAVATMAMDTTFNATFNGSMWASPLYVSNGPSGKGVFFAVTTGNDVFALDQTSGATVWHRNIGASPVGNGVPCGSIHPLGIISTPVIDANTRTIYVAGAIGNNSISKHQVDAMSVDDGTERAGFPVSTSGLMSGGTTFTPPPENQRSALSLVNGNLYVAYGGHVGDCGTYHGWVVGIDTTNPKNIGGWATLGQGEGIWAAGGMASDGNGVFAVTGNSTVGVSDHMNSDSEEVVRITGLGVLARSNQNLFFPSIWHDMDMHDLDFGSNSPIYLSVPGSTPDHFVVAISKNGHFYLLDPANLGGQDGFKVDFSIAGDGMAIHTVPAAYTTSKGVHVVLSTDGSAICPPGGPSGQVIMSVLVPPGAPPKPSVAWCAPLSGPVTAPIATTSDGTNDALVWYMNNGKLEAVDGDTGAVVYNGGNASCNGVQQWTSPIAANGRIVVGGNGHLCSWSPH